MPNLWISALVAVLLLELGFVNGLLLVSDLPEVDSVEDFRPDLVTEIYDSEGNIIESMSRERRRLASIGQVPDHVIKAFLAAEDSEFYSHPGIDLPGIARAAYQNFTNKEISQGASTITQQVVKNLLLTKERTFERKAKEALLATSLERRMTKDEILYIYLNLVYLGSGAHGIEEAAHTYFGVPSSELTLAQGAMIAGVIQAPGRLSPKLNFNAAKKRQEWVLDQMVDKGFITRRQADEALAEEISINDSWPVDYEVHPYYVDAVKRELVEILGEDNYNRGGYKVYTSLDPRLQTEAEEAIKRGVSRLNRRLGRGQVPTRYLPEKEKQRFLNDWQARIDKKPLERGEEIEALVTGYERGYVQLKVGNTDAVMPIRSTRWLPPDSRRRSKYRTKLPEGKIVEATVYRTGSRLELRPIFVPNVESALVSIDVDTRQVKALVGGSDFKRSQYNRATQSRRPPGSSMKPIVYSAAFSTKEWTPASVINDNGSPIGARDGIYWRPHNYSKRHYGITSLHTALVKSRNVVTARLAYKIGIDKVIGRAHLLGINEDFPEALSISLGAYGVCLLDITNAYSVFAAEGTYQKPVLITHIVDYKGDLVFTPPLMPEQVISTGEAYQMNWILSHVVQSGTGTRARALGRLSCGKTGTTSDYRDSWYIGYTPQLVTGVWVGRDDFTPLAYGMTGSKGALPIWLDYMRDAHRGLPKKWFKAPPDVFFKYGGCFLDGTRARKIRHSDGSDEDDEDIEPKWQKTEDKPAEVESAPGSEEDEAVSEALLTAGNDEEDAGDDYDMEEAVAEPGPVSSGPSGDNVADSRGNSGKHKKPGFQDKAKDTNNDAPLGKSMVSLIDDDPVSAPAKKPAKNRDSKKSAEKPRVEKTKTAPVEKSSAPKPKETAAPAPKKQPAPSRRVADDDEDEEEEKEKKGFWKKLRERSKKRGDYSHDGH